jgi:hypothetical protein
VIGLSQTAIFMPDLLDEVVSNIYLCFNGFWGYVDTCGCPDCPEPAKGNHLGLFPDDWHQLPKYNHGNEPLPVGEDPEQGWAGLHC